MNRYGWRVMCVAVLACAIQVGEARAQEKSPEEELQEARRLLEEEHVELTRASKRQEAILLVSYGNQANITTPAPKLRDRIVFVIRETTEAKQETKTDLSKDVSFDWDLKSLFTLDRNDRGNLVFRPINQKSNSGSFDTNDADGKQIEAKASSEHQGDATQSRKHSVTANLAGEVIEVLPNGQLIVEARKSVRVNGETQTMSLVGRVDPSDLNTDREVDSNRIIDLHVRFEGQGPMTDTTKPGLLFRLLHKVNPM